MFALSLLDGMATVAASMPAVIAAACLLTRCRPWSFSAFELLRLSEMEIPSRRGSRRAPTWACACPSTRPPRTAAGQIAALAALARELLGLPGQAAPRCATRLGS